MGIRRFPWRHFARLDGLADLKRVRPRFLVSHQRKRRDIAWVMACLAMLLKDAYDLVVESHVAMRRGFARYTEKEQGNQATRLETHNIRVLLYHYGR